MRQLLNTGALQALAAAVIKANTLRSTSNSYPLRQRRVALGLDFDMQHLAAIAQDRAGQHVGD
ncbi:hypothetical protein GTP41_07535 [Pseudoduganella sp. DS3]|uniref:Uncharacterized protein n=1 Tax=Pseudoduganella guangdongensis TaxID=2692179 RepID=A0A6N9HG04_9BURK|nr:hypothetical protein [Pseudoduganella guangdongensis]MYN01952.1 hypothetical protein [Pseudoduganella guangdongensis]